MKTTLSSTVLVRQFGDVLSRVKYLGESFVITKNDEAIAELVPLSTPRPPRWSDIAAALAPLPRDPGFADDLEQVNQLDWPAQNPWA